MPTASSNTQFPNYEVLAELERSHTRVLKAQHLPSGDLVIIKEYALATNADTLRRFEHDSQILLHLDHPNLVRVREVHLKATVPYIVMDFVEAADLRSLLRAEFFLDVPTTIRLGLQLTSAFRAMHGRQFIHRAIKPETILYRQLPSGELHVMLTDLGMGNFWTDDMERTLTDESIKCYEYAAPEQFDKPPQVDETVDYYALGVVLYECLAGKLPFGQHNERDLLRFMQQVLTAPMPAFTTVSGQPLPPSLATLLMCLLARNPQDRLSNVDQLELLLEQSRVEHLNANWSAANGPIIMPIADSVMDVVNEGGDRDEDEAERTKQTGNHKRNWWVEFWLVLAAGLAFGLYSRIGRQQPVESAIATDSISSEKIPERKKLKPKSALLSPLIRKEKGDAINLEKNTEQDTASQVRAELVIPLTPPADSVANDRPVVDSVVVLPQDSIP